MESANKIKEEDEDSDLTSSDGSSMNTDNDVSEEEDDILSNSENNNITTKTDIKETLSSKSKKRDSPNKHVSPN